MNINSKTFTLVEGAICVALAFAFSMFKIPIGAQGGSVSLAMIPLIIFAVDRGGVRWGVLAGLVYGMLHFAMTGEGAVTWESIILDYAAAFGVIGIAGLFRDEKMGVKAYLLGAIAACLARFFVHFLSGITIYAEYFEPIYKGVETPSVWLYSVVYNGFYMLFNTIAAVILSPIIGSAVIMLRKKKIIG